MAVKPIKASANSLSVLLGEYNSDSSDHDEEPPASYIPVKRAKNAQQQTTRVAVDDFVSELTTASSCMCLPVGTTSWTKCMDENTGHPYYWNTETKDVTWEVPADYQAYLDQNATILKDPRVTNMWTMCSSDESPANVYYVNELTRIVSWNKPIGFVEPTTAIAVQAKAASVEPKPKKNIIKRRKPVKSKTTNNPFSDTKDLDSEKIELISSFSVKSDSSSDEEKHRERPPGNALLKLVATDYNSDDNSSIGDTSYSTSIVKPRPSQTKTPKNRPLLELPTSETIPTKRTKPSFASIITGGRSPEHAVEPAVTNEPSSSSIECNPADEELPSPVVKMQKRKRRIEFITKAPDTSVVEDEEEDLVEQLLFAPMANVDDAVDTKAQTEIVDNTTTENCIVDGAHDKDEKTKVPIEGETHVPAIKTKVVAELNGNDLHKVVDLKDTIGAKLKFLCDGRPEVPAVQAITIQLETLLEAFDEGALQPTYMLKWLAGIANDLQTLEADAAPDGWQCLWNRSHGKYCYKHLETGCVRWEYPGSEANGGGVHEGDSNSEDSSQCHLQNAVDDEMDICTTPPPNVNEQLLLGTTGGSSKSKANFKPNTKFLEPTEPANNISLELASFYSDIAAIDSTTNTAETDAAASPVVDAPDAKTSTTTNEDSVVKKKKRKIKKLTPWRSGNLETWINKWQKAQQEMDN